MTGLGKYQKGLDLEAEGLSGSQVASRLGYRDSQAWYAAKSYYGKKQEAFAARAAGVPATMPDPLPKENSILPEEGRNAQERRPGLTQQPQSSQVPVPDGLLIQTRIEATGKTYEYTYHAGELRVCRRGEAGETLLVLPEHWEQLKAEIDAVLAFAREGTK